MITADAFEDILIHLENMDPETELESLIDRFSEEQPMLAAFLDEMGGDDFNDSEREILFFYGLAVWHAMDQASDSGLQEVTEEHLEALQEKNEAWLEKVAPELGDLQAQDIGRSMSDHPQRQVLETLFDIIIEEEIDFMRKSNLGSVLLFLKMVVDCLEDAR